MTLSLLHCCSWIRVMGFAEVVTNGQKLGNEMTRLVQMPSPLPDTSCGEHILAVLFETMLEGKKSTQKYLLHSSAPSPSSGFSFSWA